MQIPHGKRKLWLVHRGSLGFLLHGYDECWSWQKKKGWRNLIILGMSWPIIHFFLHTKTSHEPQISSGIFRYLCFCEVFWGELHTIERITIEIQSGSLFQTSVQKILFSNALLKHNQIYCCTNRTWDSIYSRREHITINPWLQSNYHTFLSYASQILSSARLTPWL